MLCPLLIFARPQYEIGLSSTHDCFQDKCGWWDTRATGCAIQVIARALDHLDDLHTLAASR